MALHICQHVIRLLDQPISATYHRLCRHDGHWHLRVRLLRRTLALFLCLALILIALAALTIDFFSKERGVIYQQELNSVEQIL
ncbi:hypothetical protein [Segatella albensis]|uniref:hypothetical protein n=1 Tax=Segatella albensis TaxID=77768 RepID=UPI000468C3EB|nr:hypothetical protein [Segatella albensis]